MLVALVDVAPAGVGLPDLDELVAYRAGRRRRPPDRSPSSARRPARRRAGWSGRPRAGRRRAARRPGPQLDALGVGLVAGSWWGGAAGWSGTAGSRAGRPVSTTAGGVVRPPRSLDLGADLGLGGHGRTPVGSRGRDRGLAIRLPLSGRLPTWPATPPPPAPRSPAARWRLLGAFDEEHRRLSLTELAERAGLPLPTAHRLVGELVDVGRAGADVVGRVRRRAPALGPRPARARAGRAASSWPRRTSTTCTARRSPPCTSRCATATEVLYLDRLRGNASVPVVSTIGSRLPMHATGVGKVLLAHAPAEVQHQVLADLPARSRRTRSPSRAGCAASSPRCCATTTRPRSRR